MSSIEIGSIVFVLLFAGGLLGMAVRDWLPEHHLSAESKDAIKFGAGLISTMAALVLGLLVASAKGSYDTQRNEITQMSARIVLLDRILAHYGPEAATARDLLRRSVATTVERIWPEDRSEHAHLEPLASSKSEADYDAIQMLSPKSDAQRTLQSQAENIAIEIGSTRWLMFEQGGSSISTPILMVLVLWLTIIFLSFGLFAPRNATVVVTMLLCALSVSGAIFLIMELNHPFEGLVKISSQPMRNALAHLGQ
jgi:hypothetical protein